MAEANIVKKALGKQPFDVFIEFREDWEAKGFIFTKVTVKNARSSGYSGGNGCVGFELRSALNAEFVKASTAEGRCTVRSVTDPSVCTLNVTATLPDIDMAA